MHISRFALHPHDESVKRLQRVVNAGEFVQKRRWALGEDVFAWFAGGAKLLGAQILVVRVLGEFVDGGRWPGE